mmetsp:Transcript_12629/g.18961  ORF Transcript_12629/g.18961 Transcript_12629/m.18961 type:complete len:362 (-) Transcript_12629:32-1117(-)|eukprot:CAMPEP_0196809932 /NCGR_PEP_ID=MMETSP1362-20130617/9807_1 /TAXON_ID=163516 /ORGANISM="Leptocylindrus danicus, Strain CCMP1856" /LENGTH=361 /DNA_ID=CAMNT_0042184777 /DNA_START=136 /DNA_END=1221 /DNA_ORIENTATION=+
MSDNDASVYTDLVEFLKSPRADLCKAAVNATASVTDQSGMEKLIKYGAVGPLCKLINRPECSGEAVDALLRLSSEVPTFCSQAATDMTEAGMVTRVLEVVLAKDKDAKYVDSALALLVNTTRTEAGAVAMLGPDGSERPVPLLTRFLAPVPTGEMDKWQNVAGVLMNLTQVEGGRQFVTRISTGVLEKLLPQLRSSNVVRRRGVAGVVKNICFTKENSFWLLHEIGIIKHLLYPLAGPEELDLDDRVGMDPELWLDGPDKVREPDSQVRLLLVEAILLLLASGRKSREHIRKQRAYVILKFADMVEESEQIGEKINECVQFLRRDEEGTEEGSSDRIFRNALPPTPSAVIYGNSNDYDDVD